MSDTIEAPKPKRTYTRKPKVVEPSIEEVVQQPIEQPVVEQSVDVKPKRKYTRKPKSSVEEVVESPVEEIPSPPELVRQTNEPVVPIEKKPRTEKQIAAFNRMREARLKKSQELECLREIAKEKQLFDKETSKVQKLEEKIVAKAQRKPRAKKVVEEYVSEPEPIIRQVSTYKPIMFV